MYKQCLAALAAGTVGTACVWGAAPPPMPPVRAEVEALVARLAAETFSERDRAAQALEGLGTAALPSLKTASQSDDPEVRRRAESLVERIERAADNTRLLAVASVRLDFRNVPLGTAVNALRTQTGIPIALDPRGVANPLRPVTVRAADLPPWQAVEAFCRAAGLREVFLIDLPPVAPSTSNLGRRRYSPIVPVMPTAATVAVTLADGQAPSIPGDRTSAVRVLALPTTFAANRIVLGSGEVTLNLDVAPIPGREWGDIIGVRVRHARDEAGRSLPASHRLDPTLGDSSDEEANNVFQRVAMWNHDANGMPIATPFPNPRIVPLTLRTGDRRVKFLRLLEGTVQIEVVVPNQTLLSVENVLKAAGTAVEGPNMTKLTIADVREEKAQITIKLRLESPSPWALQQMRARRGMAMAANAWGVGWMVEPLMATAAPLFQVIGADGKALATASTTYSVGNTDDGSRMFTELGLTFRGGSPSRLVMTGPKTLTVDVPFRLENVPLP